MHPAALAVAAVLLLGDRDGGPTRDGAGGLDIPGLVQALRAQGARVALGEGVEQPFFSAPGRFVRVNGEDVQAFEYPDADAARAEAARVSQDGGTIGTSKPFWAAAPHFYRKDRVIVLSVGETASLHAVLQAVLGPPFAGP